MQAVEVVTRERVIGLEYSKDAKMFSIPSAMKSAYGVILEELKTQSFGESDKAVVYTRYRDVDLGAMECMGFFAKLMGMFDTFKMDMGISIDEFDYTKSTFKTGEIKAGEYVQYLHVGPYSKMHQAYGKLSKYVVENNINVEHQTYDIYLNDPRVTSKEKLETIIMVKVAS